MKNNEIKSEIDEIKKGEEKIKSRDLQYNLLIRIYNQEISTIWNDKVIWWKYLYW